MLKEIIIKNFRSYRNEVTFTMEADVKRVSEYKENHITNINGNSMLKVTSLYGPNGGGKSNLILAILYAKLVVTNIPDFRFLPKELVNIFNEKEPIELTLYFIDENYEYGYNLIFNAKTVDLQGDITNRNLQYETKNEIIFESMGVRRKDEENFITLYERNESGEVESELFEKYNITMAKLSKGKTVLKKLYEDYGDNENNEEFFTMIRGLYNQFDSIDTLGSSRYVLNTNALMFVEQNKTNILKYLNSVDIKLSDIKVYKEGKPYKLYFERIININGVDIKREIAFAEESEGTKKIFIIILEILNGMKQNCIFLVDDLNSFLHPKLCASVIEQFTSKNNSYSQLIFNSHDLINMNNELFRRDEIWLAYRDENYSSVIVPLSNIVDFRGKQVRKDVVYSKQYLEGKFGSDPFIKKGLNWYE